MKKKIFSLVCALAMVLSLTPISAKASETSNGTNTSDDVYVLMNVPYSEFYEAETVTDDEATTNNVKVDAFTSATKAKTRTGTLAGGSYHVDNSGDEITGVICPVKLGSGVTIETIEAFGGTKITDASVLEITTSNRGTTTTATYNGYKALFESPSYSYYVLGEAPKWYKELTVSEDEKVFGKVQGEATTVESKATFTTDTTYGDYELDLDQETLESYIDFADGMISGVVVTTTDGTNYGLRHMENIWRGYALAWCTGFTDAVHNCPTSSEHYKSMMGKTIDYVTYYTDMGIYKFDISNTYVPKKFAYTLTVSENEGQKAAVSLEGLDSVEGYEPAYAVDGTSVTVTNNVFSTENLKPGTHEFVVSDQSGVYADLKASFVVSTDDVVVTYDAEKSSLIAANGFTADDVQNFIANITSVTVNDKSYSATGRGSVKLINTDGTLVTDAEAFAEEGSYSVTVCSTGYKDVSFTYEKKSSTENTGNSSAGGTTGQKENNSNAAGNNNTNTNTNTNVTSGPVEDNNTTSKVSVAKVKGIKLSSASKKIKVSWKKLAGVTGYQVQYSTSKKFKKAKIVNVKKAKTVKATLKKGLKKGKRYYVRVCAYKTVSGKKTTGKWSAVKSVKVKK